MRKNQGFTLVELMITISIIGILFAIALPSFQSNTRQAGRADAYTALLRMADMQERFYLQNNTYADQTAIDSVGTSATKEGYYKLKIVAASANSFTLTADVVDPGPQATDTDCLAITLTSAGLKTPATCW